MASKTSRIVLVLLATFVLCQLSYYTYNRIIFDINNVAKRFECSNCSFQNVRYMISPSDICTSDTNMVIVVTSKHSQTQNRDMIRQTWGSRIEQERFKIKIVFMLGEETDDHKNVQLEAQLHGDVIQIEFREYYHNIGVKTIEVLKWTLRECRHVKYVMKADDDVFINLEKMTATLNHYDLDRVIGGKCISYAMPDRRSHSKHYLGHDIYPYYFFPPYCAGMGYIMSPDTAEILYKDVLNTKFLAWEDVYIGIVAYKAGIRLQDIPGIHDMKFDYRYDCTVLDHKINVDDVLAFWNSPLRNNLRSCRLRWISFIILSLFCFVIVLTYSYKRFRAPLKCCFKKHFMI